MPVHRSNARLLALIVLPIALAGCKKATDSLTEAAIEHASNGKVKVERDGARTVIKTRDGEMAMQAGKALPLPKDFPADVYLPGKYSINSVMDMGGMQVLSMQAPGEVAGLFADARSAMEAQGWKQTMAMQNASDNAMLSFEKDKRATVLSFNQAQDQGVTMSVQVRSRQ